MMSQAKTDAETYRQAAALNREDPFREGSTLVFPDYGQLVMTGDLHGHRRNFERIQNYCALEHAAVRHVLLHELIHEEPPPGGGMDMSHEALLAAAKWKCEYPDQVHFLQSNHELSQLTNQDICKGGRMVTFNYLMGVRETYGAEADLVVEAMMEFLASHPLAARTPNRVFLSHSLPSPHAVPVFDPSVLTREPRPEDLAEGGSAYLLVWGRYHTQEALDELARRLDVDLFICGHQPQEDGYQCVGTRMMIVASDHNHGVILPFDLRKPYDLDGLERQIRPLASIA